MMLDRSARSKFVALLLGCSGLLAAIPAFGETALSVSKVVSDVKEQASSSPTGSVDRIQQNDPLAIDDDDAVAGMDKASSTVRGMLADSRQRGDLVRAACLDDRLSQIDVALRTGRERKVALKAAVDSKDSDKARRESIALKMLRRRSDSLLREAGACLGEDVNYGGGNRLSFSLDPDVSRQEGGWYPGSIQGESPAASSGYGIWSPGGQVYIEDFTYPPRCVSCFK